MLLKLKTLRTLIREAICISMNEEEAAEELTADPTSTLDPLVDPANNPTRPDDPYDYLGMHPDPGKAMAHPGAGGAAGGASDSVEAVGGDITPPDVTPSDEKK